MHKTILLFIIVLSLPYIDVFFVKAAREEVPGRPIE
jgi:hypothetical protein